MKFDDAEVGELVDFHLGLLPDDADPDEQPMLLPGGEESDEEPEGDEESLGVGVLSTGDLDEEDEDDDSDPSEFLEGTWEDDPEDVDAEAVDTLDDRDKRVADYDGDAPNGEIRQYLRETGLATDVQEALAEIGTEEHDEPAPRGSVLDLKNVIRRVAGDTTVDELYRQRRERPGDDVAVGVSVDMSGSMSKAERDAKAAIGAFLFGVQQFGGEVVANAWQGHGEISHITGSYERFEWRHLDTVSPGGADPIAKGMLECARLLERTRPQEQLLVVITDGKPTVTSRDDGDYSSAVDEAADTVTELRSRGLIVVGFGFGSVKPENLEAMFGADGYRHVDIEDLADGLVEFFAEQVGARSPAMV
ncbi:vWA domain-containing protein [Halobaculum magnesiiphilum]|uniref:VWA domain-containing protein n=1 Tax=Halobaculum magnesiiphilum TaxID=1017351 RepID=A0A8T8WB40_9EURY|nr:VWA domain-containing protein [Halobaculum magnesiiphilum]QZP37082.1 VWA domain-containing protein [Halobaculum magnesiiphilum]